MAQFIPLFAYSTIHFLRMGVSFVMADIEKTFSIGHIELGAVQASTYIMIGLGYMYLMFRPVKKALPQYLLNMGLAGALFVLWGLWTWRGLNKPWVLMIFLAICGFVQAVAWPVCIKIMYQSFTYRNNGFFLGLWSASGDMGNILSFYFNTLLVYSLHLPWESCIVLAGLLTLIMAFMMRFCVKDKDQNQEPLFEHPLEAIPSYFSSWNNRLLLLILCLLKSTLYGVLLWLPMYFRKSGFQEFTGYIPMAFSLMTIFGSITLGWLYECVHHRHYISAISTSLIGVMVILLCAIKTLPMDPQHKWSFLPLIGVVGLCLGGVLNQLMSIESKVIAEQSHLSLYFISTLFMTFSCISVGVTELLIGVSTSQDEKAIFLFFIGLGLVALIFSIVRSCILRFISFDEQDDSDQLSD